MAKFHVTVTGPGPQHETLLSAEVECGLVQNAPKMAFKLLDDEQLATFKAAGELNIVVVPAQRRLRV